MTITNIPKGQTFRSSIMTRKTAFLAAAAALLVLSGLDYYLVAQPTEFVAGVGTESRYGSIGLQEQDFDRTVCQQDCVEKYGGPSSGANTPRTRLYALCMQECERQFWKQFDRRTKELEQEK
jgi:hypothetical protein